MVTPSGQVWPRTDETPLTQIESHEYSTLSGGSDFDSASGLAVDSSGNTYIAGGTSSLDRNTSIFWGAFVVKLTLP